MLTAAAFLLALCVLIVFHELGHYWVARLCGVKVLRFSLGFGKPLYRKQFQPGGTEWVVAAFPLGGYVKMLGEQGDQDAPIAAADLPFAFNRKSVWMRICIVAAGPLANFLLAIVIYWGLFVYGMPGQRPLLDTPGVQTAAAAAGIARWDVIEAIDAEPVQTWEDVNWRLAKKLVEGGELDLTLRSADGRVAQKRLQLHGLTGNDLDKDFLSKLGLLPAKSAPARLGKILPGSPAENAGLQVGDLVLALDGKRVADWAAFTEVVRAQPEKTLLLEVQRQAHTRSIAVTPKREVVEGKTIGRIGVASDLVVTAQYPLGEALLRGAVKCWDTSIFSLKILGRMITGDVSWRNLSGPVTIAQVAGETASIGWLPYLLFIALVSVSLGVMNLLPLPILDGGHLMYYMAEVLKGSPVSLQAMEIGQRVGIAVLVLLMGLALYNDIVRLLGQ
jgi:regulator of sigma E protease